MSEEKVCCICGNEVINSSIGIEAREETRLVCSTCIGEGLIRLAHDDESLNEVVMRSVKEAADAVKRLMEEEES